VTGTDSLLRVEGLSVDYRSRRNTVSAVRDISFTVAAGETVALVGGSGSGKSTTAHSIVRLLPPSAVIGSGQVILGGDELTRLGRRALRSVRGRRVGLTPQDPAVSLNPVLRIGRQVAEVLLLHGLADRKNASVLAAEALEAAGLDQPMARARQYPHELSGGMRQRVLIAIALAARPALVIADEATSALDVLVQAEVLDLLRGLVRERGLALLLVTHDLAVVAEVCDRVLVCDHGRVVEQGAAAEVVARPAHPKTRELLQAALVWQPDLDTVESDLVGVLS
jgi:peptide/nickel transport system ATP-binding protein